MLQQGKGSDLGSAFGGGSSDSLFGPLVQATSYQKLHGAWWQPFYLMPCLCLSFKTRINIKCARGCGRAAC